MAKRKLTSSKEDYLEAIWVLESEDGVARVRDIAARLDVGKSAVTAALKSLAERDLVNYDPYEFITLTDRGRELAKEVDRGHQVLRRFLMEVLGLAAEVAEANACRMEHVVDNVVLQRLTDFVEFIERGSPGEQKRMKSFLKRCSAKVGRR